MNILGLHFGHDASVSVIVDGAVVSHILVERHIRAKHAVGIRDEQIESALAQAGISLDEVDYCAVVSTQDLEILVGLIDGLSLRLVTANDTPIPSPFAGLLAQAAIDPHRLLSFGLKGVTELTGADAEDPENDRWPKFLPEWSSFCRGDVASVGWMNAFTSHSAWEKPRGLDQIRKDGIDPQTFGDAVRLGMHFPIELEWCDKTIPGCFVDHHVCHAASVFYRSGFERAAIITHDGGDAARNLSGFYCYGEGSKLFVLAPHHLALGGFYRAAGIRLGFDAIGPEGKMMGLTSYGKPQFFDQQFVGNIHDLNQRFGANPFPAWMDHCLSLAKDQGYDLSHGTADLVLNEISKDIAMSTQMMFEEGYLLAAGVIRDMLKQSKRDTDNLCLSGGAALNCPSNSRLWNDGPYSDIYIEPNCDDGGLSIGAAFYLYHNVLGNNADDSIAKDNRSPFKGMDRGMEAVDTAVAEAGKLVMVEKCDDAAARARRAAEDLHADRIVAWYEGRSEMGPRALCHRSLLSNPVKAENWVRVNKVKGREAWRPFAPVVLEAKMNDWFEGCPTHSPYMLYTAQVRSKDLPAITHVDGSSRIQTVTPDSGVIHDVLVELDKLNGVPVSMNTSLNGPGEPIVETPAEALAFFERSDVDVLYLEDWRISRN